jgi:hypothetical protein
METGDHWVIYAAVDSGKLQVCNLFIHDLHVGRFDYTADYLCCMMDKQKEIQMSFSLLLSELGWQVAM